MATSTTLRTRTALTRIAKLSRISPRSRDGSPEEYQILFRVLEHWGRISILFIVEGIRGPFEKRHVVHALWASGNVAQEGWRHWVFLWPFRSEGRR